MQAVLSPRAVRDLLAAIAWIAEDSRRAARELREAVSRALDQLGRYPEMGHAAPDLAALPVRFWTLRRYNYVLVYDSEARPPRVLRVLHGARDLNDLLRDGGEP